MTEISPVGETLKHSSRVLDEVFAERSRQIQEEDWTIEHDDQHTDRSLASAAACYAFYASMSQNARQLATRILTWDCGIHSPITLMWPTGWDLKWFKPSARRRDLIKAAALLIAEIERLDREKAKHGERVQT